MANEISATWLKEVDCPVCGFKFNVEMIRTSKVRVIENYDDFGRKYSDELNPLLYSTWTCPKCLYSGNKEDEYYKLLPEIKVRILKHNSFLKKISNNTNFLNPRTPESAIKSLLLSTLCYRIRRISRGTNASCFMRICWIIRNEGHPAEKEKKFLKKALRDYVFAMSKEYSPNFGKISEFGIYYIIGLLYYKLGNHEKAKEYINQVIINKKKTEAFIVNFASILHDDLKNFKPVATPAETVQGAEENKAEWLNELDLTLE